MGRGLKGVGFTILQLMICLVLISILMALAAPAFQQLISSMVSRSEAVRLMSALNYARSEAISRVAPVTVCPINIDDTDAGSCGNDYSDGWAVFAEESSDLAPSGSKNIQLKAFHGSSRGVSVLNRKGTRVVGDKIVFLGDGTSRRNMTLLMCGAGLSSERAWSVVISLVGRVRLQRGWGNCPLV